MITVIGIGNALRGDDAAGPALARKIKDRAPDGVTVVEHGGEGASLLDLLNGKETVILVDAVQSGAAPGTLHRFDAARGPVAAQSLRCSTHNFSVHDAIEMARALDQLPKRFIVLGIEGAEFEPGAGLSPAVEAALGGAADALFAEIEKLKKEIAACTNNR